MKQFENFDAMKKEIDEMFKAKVKARTPNWEQLNTAEKMLTVDFPPEKMENEILEEILNELTSKGYDINDLTADGHTYDIYGTTNYQEMSLDELKSVLTEKAFTFFKKLSTEYRYIILQCKNETFYLIHSTNTFHPNIKNQTGITLSELNNYLEMKSSDIRKEWMLWED